MKSGTDSTFRSSAVDTAALMLRLTAGPMLFYHGYNKVRGPGGLEGTTRWFAALGLKPPAVHARLAAATELAAGTAMTLGLASPAPAAATIGLMTVAAQTDHKGKGFFVFKGGWEYTAVVSAVAATQALLGSGRFSLDRLFRNRRAGILWAFAAAAVGVASAFGLLRAAYEGDQQADEPAS